MRVCRHASAAQLRIIPLLGTWVNKAPGGAPDPLEWHHAHGVARRRRASWRAEEEASVSVEEINKALVRRFIEEVYNRGNMDVADELLAPNFVSRDAFTGEEASREDLNERDPDRAREPRLAPVLRRIGGRRLS
jgi:hypothetical protein